MLSRGFLRLVDHYDNFPNTVFQIIIMINQSQDRHDSAYLTIGLCKQSVTGPPDQLNERETTWSGSLADHPHLMEVCMQIHVYEIVP